MFQISWQQKNQTRTNNLPTNDILCFQWKVKVCWLFFLIRRFIECWLFSQTQENINVIVSSLLLLRTLQDDNKPFLHVVERNFNPKKLKKKLENPQRAKEELKIIIAQTNFALVYFTYLILFWWCVQCNCYQILLLL